MSAKMTISASASRKLNHSVYGGAQYESSDLWESESREVPVAEWDKMSPEEQRDYYKVLREIVNTRLDLSIKLEIDRIKNLTECKNPICKQKANLKYGTLCFLCNKAVKNGAEIISKEELDKRNAPIETDKNGAPIFN